MPNVLAKVLTAEIDRAVAGLGPMYDAVPVHVEEVPTARVMPFASRFTAGQQLGQALARNACANAVVLGLAYGGTAVAQGVAQELGLPFDTWLARRLMPLGRPGLVLGVVSEGASLSLDRYGLARASMTDGQIRALVKDTAEQMAIDARRLRHGRAALPLAGRTVILVDDGMPAADLLATAIEGVRRRDAARVVVAAPVGKEAAVASLAGVADEVVCLMIPARLRRVGAWYQDFRAVSDGAVMKMLAPATVR